MHFAIYRYHTPHALLFFGAIDPRPKHESVQLPSEVARDHDLPCNLSSVFAARAREGVAIRIILPTMHIWQHIAVPML